ncbi:exosporium glycoprotein BclB-related protein [Sporosarcina sp. FSL K6-1522]|uniref:exosporium glycoprotein BclB-related protein n=1 Tax=Sporosarcina sp. FSL K6-1522 TaxID=2921554 RepID=UPI00315AD2CE
MTCNHGCNSGACGSKRHGKVNCKNFGPFNAIDAACILPPAIKGSVIPFASGLTPMVLTSVLNDLVSTGSLVAFGTNIPTAGVLGNTIDLTGAIGGLLNESFSVPRAGTVTSISATFTPTVALVVTGATTVVARLYHAPAGSGVFTATDVAVNLAPNINLIAVGGLVEGTSSNFAPLAVNPGDRLLMTFSTTSAGLASVVTGTASAGITIA